ncbi:hypothetical protein DL93DRAFT_2049071 [Clavulina sp. PMI_390]|nr:hypothetical protein DL93DRAFT_2049071 [Clavulina sp. PMI_390]
MLFGLPTAIEPPAKPKSSLGKRKLGQDSAHKASSSASTTSVSTLPDLADDEDYDSDSTASTSSYGEDSSNDENNEKTRTRIASVNTSRTSLAKRSRKYYCPVEGCGKAYTKPSRLSEHERSHTGQRPFVCAVCGKAYIRENHLQAHSRSHLPESHRPYSCDHSGVSPCNKRFWTKQHLDAHIQKVHLGVKPYKCEWPECEETFAKQHQLRAHVAAAHCTPGTKPFRCEHEGCDKSFATSQHLRTHGKVHQENRYACSYESCRTQASGSTAPPSVRYFSTWSDLQRHLREDHPPTCPYPECNGQTFSAQKGLKAHLRIHEGRNQDILAETGIDEEDADEVPSKRQRRGGEFGREWKCSKGKCDLSFKSKKALTNHEKVTHDGERRFVCPAPDCGMKFGYKHVLQRHVARKHPRASSEEANDTSSEADPATDAAPVLDLLTGRHYENRTTKIPCPWPRLHPPTAESAAPCAFTFSRVYDARRHLRAEHGLDIDTKALEAFLAKS